MTQKKDAKMRGMHHSICLTFDLTQKTEFSLLAWKWLKPMFGY